MKASDAIADFLRETGCSHVFGYPGGAVTHLVDSLTRRPGTRFVGTYHEQAAAFAAEGFARMTNNIGAAVATSGPGATNLLTGIGSAWFDSIPCLYITGQVNTYEYKGGSNVRQLGFQETDIVSVASPIAKYAVRVTHAADLRYELEKAVSIARSGRKGPALVDIPMDIQRAEVDWQNLRGYVTPAPAPSPTVLQMDEVIGLLNGSSRPVLLVGGGVRLASAAEQLRLVAEKLRIPVVSSLMGRDAFDNGSELYLGMVGAYGNRYANLTVANSDLVLALGTRLDTRQTGTNPASFARGARLIRVDVDRDELGHRIKPDELGIQADVGVFLSALNERAGEIRPDTGRWLSRVWEYRRRYPTGTGGGYPDPNSIMEAISGSLGPRDAVCLDVGQNQMWAAQLLRVTGQQRLLTSGGMGAMGFALPSAIGAWYSGTADHVVAIAGDGGMQMNIQELALVARNRIPVKIAVLNNRSLGMIRQFQEQYFDSRFAATVSGYTAPDFCAVAEAYGVRSRRITSREDMPLLRDALRSDGAMLIEIMLPQDTRVLPKLSVNRPIEEQDPQLDRAELAGNMVIAPYEPDTGGERDMDSYRQRIMELLDAMKGKPPGGELQTIPIPDGRGAAAGQLRPITADWRQSLPGCAEKLARWRNEHQAELSAQPFMATASGTARWLDELVLAREDRILFLILAADGSWVGHIGYSCFDFAARGCDVDAVLRGEQGHPGIMTHALRALLRWGTEGLGLLDIRLKVFADNERAIAFYRRNGFAPVAKPELSTPAQGKRYIEMRLEKLPPAKESES